MASPPPPPSPSPTNEEIEEQIHFSSVVQTFEQYASYALSANSRRRKDYYQLSLEDKKLLDDVGVGAGYKKKLIEVDDLILRNGEFLKMIVADSEIFLNAEDDDRHVDGDRHLHDSIRAHKHGHEHGHEHTHTHSLHEHHPYDHINHSEVQQTTSRKWNYKPTDFDIDKLISTLKQFVRDWSVEGKPERDACYVPILQALIDHFNVAGVSDVDRASKLVLVPGAGLGRLVFEIARLGFSCQGNEFSHYMLLPSFHILNRTNKINEHTIYPFIHSFSNNRSPSSLLRPITIPDVLPSEIPKHVGFSYVAGDFEEVYGAKEGNPQGHEVQDGQWDAVATCFFIDTAKNIVNYLRIIYRLLAPGGVWINLGPLLWHFENNTSNDLSIELDLEEVKKLAKGIGFELQNEKFIKTGYVNNKESMLGHNYDCAFWTATKRG